MKILILHHCDGWGGAGVSLFDICRMLSSAHEVTVCLPHLGSEVDEQLKKIDGIATIAVDAPMGMISAYNGGPKFFSRTFAKNLYRIKGSRKKFKEILGEKKYDLVIVNSITLVWAAKTAKKAGVPALAYVRETKVKNLGYALCRRLINRYCAGVAYISKFDQVNTKSKVKNQAVIHDCLDLEKYSLTLTRKEACAQFGLEEEPFKFLYVGGGDELKGYSVMIEAVGKLSQPDFQLVIAGDVKEEQKIKAKKVVYLGKVFDMPTLYRACDALVFPSTKGHQARPIFEAGAMRLPVVISNFPETADALRDGENGLVFPPKNSIALAACMEKLLVDGQLCEKLGKSNYENTLNNHDFKVCQRQLLDFCGLCGKQRMK